MIKSKIKFTLFLTSLLSAQIAFSGEGDELMSRPVENLFNPNCQVDDSPSVRLKKVSLALRNLTEASDDDEVMKQSANKTLVATVAAHLLPDNEPFAQHDKMCWVHFEKSKEALESLTKAKTELAQSVQNKELHETRANWLGCLSGADDKLKASAEYAKCLDLPPRSAAQKPEPQAK